jgi:hypothetical protein
MHKQSCGIFMYIISYLCFITLILNYYSFSEPRSNVVCTRTASMLM